MIQGFKQAAASPSSAAEEKLIKNYLKQKTDLS
jgi:hypothetical protein